MYRCFYELFLIKFWFWTLSFWSWRPYQLWRECSRNIIYFTLFLLSFILNLLGWHWFSKSYRFHVTTQQNIICTLHRVPIAPSEGLFPYPPPAAFAYLYRHPFPLSLWLAPHCRLCLCVLCKCVLLLNPSTFFNPVPQP